MERPPKKYQYLYRLKGVEVIRYEFDGYSFNAGMYYLHIASGQCIRLMTFETIPAGYYWSEIQAIEAAVKFNDQLLQYYSHRISELTKKEK